MPTISVIVPVYKAEAYLHDCVDSILSQTFSDFELLLVDDGSPDNCLAVCRAYAARDPRVQVFHQENQGQAAARNLALQYAAGQWVSFVDSDDSIHPQMLERLYGAAQESGASVAQCQMLEAVERPEDFLRERSGAFIVYEMDEPTLVDLFDREKYPGWVSCAKLIKRELIEVYPFTAGRVYEDNEAVCRWICRAGRIASMEEDMYFYRGNPESTTQMAFSKKRLDYLWALESIIRFYGERNWLTLQQRFCGLYADAAAGYYRTCLEEGWQEEASGIRKNAYHLMRKDHVKLTKRQFEILLDGFHPKLMPAYWILEAICRRMKGI